MPSKDQDEHFGAEETDQRLGKILRGAFSGPPTPLKAIPKKRKPSRPSPASRKAKKSA